jgi:beta-glucosidase-like glycosyl hydrolase
MALEFKTAYDLKSMRDYVNDIILTMSFYNRILPRLNGAEIEDRFDYYLGLVKRGVIGFIVFGGELETVRTGIKKLRQASDKPLMIASDLEQGLGQQIKGGTLFPPAMAIASALKDADRQQASLLLKKLYSAFALEAGYAGINTILAPVLDINTNPENPIIATRAFGEDAETVSFFGCEMIKVLQGNDIMACGKHFPGHGDTETDSHISLPSIKRGLPYLENNELKPFKRAIDTSVKMIMLGHLSVPAIDPSGLPLSISAKAVGYLKDGMGFNGVIITDAMNMGGISEYTEEEASLIALKAGVDIILHPADADKVASYLKDNNYFPQSLDITIPQSTTDAYPDFSEHRKLSEGLTRMAVRIDGDFEIKRPFVVVLNDENNEKGMPFIDALRRRYPDIRHRSISPDEDMPWRTIPQDDDLIICIFSQVKAWKGRTSGWLRKNIDAAKDRAMVFISFGNPYLLNSIRGHTAKIYAYWDSDTAQKSAAERLINPGQAPF